MKLILPALILAFASVDAQADDTYADSKKIYPELTAYLAQGNESPICGYAVNEVETIVLDRKKLFFVNWEHDCASHPIYAATIFASIRGKVIESNIQVPSIATFEKNGKTYNVGNQSMFNKIKISGVKLVTIYAPACENVDLLGIGTCANDINYELELTYKYTKGKFVLSQSKVRKFN